MQIVLSVTVYGGEYFCCNHACDFFSCNHAVRSFCSIYSSDSFCIEYVDDNLYYIFAGGSLCCNYAGGIFYTAYHLCPHFLENKQNSSPHPLCDVGEIQLWLTKTNSFTYLLLQIKPVIIETFNFKVENVSLTKLTKKEWLSGKIKMILGNNTKWVSCQLFGFGRAKLGH